MIEKPLILTLNLTEKANDLLKSKGFNIYKGSFGKLVETNNDKYEFKYCLPNHDFPPNIHEYDIVIIDLSNEEHIPYKIEEHTRTKNKSKNNLYLLSEHPQTIFDTRGFASNILSEEIEKIIKRESIIIVIQNENIPITYEIVSENGDNPQRKSKQEYSIFSFMPFFPFSQNKFGKETNVLIENSAFKRFLEKYNNEFKYETTYYHPYEWIDNERVLNPNFYSLMGNKDGEIISFAYLKEKYGLYLFPRLKDNSEFILEFLQTIAPAIHPKVFPYSSENLWTVNSQYHLPNHKKLLLEKQKIEKDYESALKIKNEEIKLNNEKYKYLHDILTESGDNLVKAVIKYFNWIGFEKVIDVDSTNSELKEEDLQIETDKGLIVIEVKGIGGTSKDSECSQIQKNKYRRIKERGTFDVFGLYLVNHQRHLPPLERQFPPFTKEQIKDSINDERGLLTTWQLFQLYFDVEYGIISKEDARQDFYNFGFIIFKPSNLLKISPVKETYQKGFVSILTISNVNLKIGDELFVEKDNRFGKCKILEIRVNDESVESVSNGEIGIKTNMKITKNSMIWKKNLP